MTSPTTKAVLRVYDRDAATLRGTVSAGDVSWVDELGDEGSASYTVPFLQAALASDPALFDEAIVKVAVPLMDGGEPVEVFAWLAEPGAGTLVAQREDAARQESFTCRGIMALLDDYVLFPDGGLREQAEDERFFGFMSRSFDDSGWFVPETLEIVLEADRFPEELAALDPPATLIGYDPILTTPVATGADFLARTTFAVTGTTSARIYAYGDDYMTLYLDAEQVFTTRNVGIEVNQMKAYDVDLVDGTHVIAAKVVNGRFGPPNFTSLYVLVVSLDNDGNPDGIITRSQGTGWLVHPNSPAQGQTGAEMMLRAHFEATTRGIDSAARVVPDFTGGLDSEGVAWSDLQERSFRVGDKGWSGMGKALDSGGIFDMEVTPGLVWKAYKNQGTDKSGTVALAKGVNLMSYTWRGRQVVATRIITRSSESWGQVTNAGAEIAGTDAREHAVDVGAETTSVLGKRAPEFRLGDFSRTRRTYTALMVALDGCVPYLDFGKGDLVSAPNYLDVPTPMQVLSIGGQANGEGPVLWTVELVEVA